MFSFRDYKKLNYTVRSMATRYWAEVIKGLLGAVCANQILAAHKSPNETRVPGWSNNTSRYWNRMLRGEPASREINVNFTETVLPGTKAILTHPLWHLLGATDITHKLLMKVFLALPASFHSKVYGTAPNGLMCRKRVINKKFLVYLSALNSLDALTCLLALALEAKLEENQKYLPWYEMGVIKVLLRLSVLTEIQFIYGDLYRSISALMNQSQSDIERLSAHDIRLTPPLRIIPADWFDINHSVALYRQVLEIASNLGLVSDKENHKFLFLYSVNHVDLDSLYVDLLLLSQGESRVEVLSETTKATLRRFERSLIKPKRRR